MLIRSKLSYSSDCLLRLFVLRWKMAETWACHMELPWYRFPVGQSGSADIIWSLLVRFLSCHSEFPSRRMYSCQEALCLFVFHLRTQLLAFLPFLSPSSAGLERQLLWRPLPYVWVMEDITWALLFNAEYLPHAKWESETGRFWICPSSLQVCMSIL